MAVACEEETDLLEHVIVCDVLQSLRSSPVGILHKELQLVAQTPFPLGSLLHSEGGGIIPLVRPLKVGLSGGEAPIDDDDVLLALLRLQADLLQLPMKFPFRWVLFYSFFGGALKEP